jgi:Ala-tRNA(Pro) deacylase
MSMRVPEFLRQQGVPFETVVHPPAFTAQRQARCLHVPGKQLAKSVLLKGPQGDLLAVLPATHHVDLESLAQALGGPVRLATEAEVAEVFRDCEWGVRTPFGALYGLPTLLDDSFDSEEFMVFEAHLHAIAIRMRCRDFERLEKPRRLRLGVDPHLGASGQ